MVLKTEAIVSFTLWFCIVTANSVFLPGFCELDSCQNGASCHPGINHTHWCRCPEAFTGPLCIQPRCFHTCHNEGVCAKLDDGSFGCKCPYGFTGPSCERRMPKCIGAACKCSKNYCANGGTCSLNRSGQPECSCASGFVGERCQVEWFNCRTPNLCQNRGQCEYENKFYCNCTDGFKGKYCESERTPFDCTAQGPNSCRNGGFCPNSANGTSLLSCVCPPNYEGTYCENDVNECDISVPCENGGTCVNVPGGFQCICSNGWEGERCTVNTDDCSINPCAPGSVCVDGLATYTCICPPGKIGVTCNVNDQCASNPCRHGRCESDPDTGEYQCRCQKGYTGVNCDKDVNECERTNPCKRGGRCVNTLGSFVCECPRGFSGEFCEKGIDYCKSDSCMNGGSCVGGHGNFTCICLPQYGGNFCEIRCPEGFHGRACDIPIVPCKSSDCENGGHCDGAICVCPPPFSGRKCERTPCSNISCPFGEQCITDLTKTSGYKCACPIGLYGLGCLLEVDECASNPCQHGGFCEDLFRDYVCKCPSGYRGKNCERSVDHCESSPCLNDGQCINEADGFLCHCGPAFYGENCQSKRDPCQRHRCDNGAECLPTLNYRNYTCDCKEGYEGQFCEMDVDECRLSPCRHGGSCHNSHGSYSCICPEGYNGKNCEKNIDDCANAPCLNNGTCIDLLAGFQCNCPLGFTGKRCAINVDDCEPNPCMNGATCLDGVNSYECLCRPGFSGRDCHINDDDCRPGLCLNGGRCIDHVNDYKCECGRGFTGKNCQQYIDLDKYNITDSMERAMCKQAGCDSKASDGHCDAECNFFACDFDGRDCSAQDEPYARCNAPSYCAHVFHDGKCDSICNNENCLFDGFDCDHSHVERCPASIRQFCRDHFQDGHCDPACNQSGCEWDGGDCEKEKKTLSGELAVIILVEPSLFVSRSRDFLSGMSKALRLTVRIKSDDIGPMVFSWSINGGDGERVSFPCGESLEVSYDRSERSRREVNLRGVMVWIEVDVTNCKTNCFSDVATVASYIGATMAKKDLTDIGMPVYSAVVRPEHEEASTNSTFWEGIGIGIVVLVLVIATISMLQQRQRKRKMIEAPVWMPPTEQQNKAACLSHSENSLRLALFNAPYFAGKRSKIESLPYISSETFDFLPPKVEPKFKEPVVFPEYSELHEQAASQDSISLPIDTSLVNLIAGSYGRTPLMCLAETKKSNAVQDAVALFNAGALLDLQDKDGETAVFIAVRNGRYALAKTLLDLGADATIPNNMESMCMHKACGNLDTPMVKLLLEYPPVVANLDYVDCLNRTPLMINAKDDCISIDIAEMLIEHGADICTPGDKGSISYNGRTALHYAAQHNNFNMVKLLCEKDANKDAQDLEERTPIFLAASEGKVQAVKVLIDAGASLEITDQKDRSPRDVALEKHHFDVANLLEAGATSIPMPPAIPLLGKKKPISRPMKKVIAKRSQRAHPLTPPSDSSHYSTTPSPHDTNYGMGTSLLGSVMDSPPSEGVQNAAYSPPHGSQTCQTPWSSTTTEYVKPSPPYDYTDLHHSYYGQQQHTLTNFNSGYGPRNGSNQQQGYMPPSCQYSQASQPFFTH